ncbi:MAG: hypothetical protein WDN49_06465 [Acetobacteraceae bacterium]
MLKAIMCVLSVACLQPAWADTVHSVDQIPSRLKTPEGKAFVAQQMDGAPAPDGLGVHLPPGLPAKTITSLLVPADDAGTPNLIGAKPWSGRADSFVAIVCTGGEGPLAPNEPQCARSQDDDAKRPLHVYLGVIEVKDGAAPRLVAGSGPVDGAVNWAKSGLPAQPMAVDDANGADIRPDSFDRFDLAAYKVAPDVQAFGLRGAWQESYSGGGAAYGSLQLFVLDGDRIKPILAAPMSAYSDVAGDWHKDGTRDHTILDGANVLVVAAHSVDHYFDLTLKSRAGHWQRLFRWSQAAGAYRPVGN